MCARHTKVQCELSHDTWFPNSALTEYSPLAYQISIKCRGNSFIPGYLIPLVACLNPQVYTADEEQAYQRRITIATLKDTDMLDRLTVFVGRLVFWYLPD